MKVQCWREVALGWFDAFDREFGAKHFQFEFLYALRRGLEEGDELDLVVLQRKHKKTHSEYLRIARTSEIEDGWAFAARYEGFFVALCELALEDFKPRRFGRHEEETGVYCGDYNQHRETGEACNGCGMFSGHEDDPCPDCEGESTHGSME